MQFSSAGKTCGMTNNVNNNIVGQDPMLLVLADYGGQTQTRALKPNSPAIDKSRITNVIDNIGQRFVSRSGDLGAPDIGAFELIKADQFEPNDNFGSATLFRNRVSIESLTIDETGLEPPALFDQDYYQFNLNAGQSVSVDVLFVDDKGDIDVELFDPSDASVAGGFSVSDNESFSYEAVQSGLHRLRVSGFGGAKNIYDLEIDSESFDDLCIPIKTSSGTVTLVCL